MSATSSTHQAATVGGWRKKLLWLGGFLLVLLVVTYFTVTSGAFFKGVIVPKLGQALNAEISVADASISPFSQVLLRQLKVTPRGGEPLLEASELRLRYRLMPILRGTMAVEELALVSPTVSVVQNADGTSNLDTLLQDESPAPQATADQPSGPIKVDIQSVTVNNATLRHITHRPDGGRDAFELANGKLSLSGVKNGGTGRLELQAGLALDQANRNGETSGLAATLNAKFDFDLTTDLSPARIQGEATLLTDQASGILAELQGLCARLQAETSPTEVKLVSLRFDRSGVALGEVRATGPFNATKGEGKLKFEMLALDRAVLNLAGAAAGLDFGTTTINATNEIEITRGGDQLAIRGRLEVARFQVSIQQQTTPTLDLNADYQVLVDNAAQSARLEALTLRGVQNNRPLLAADLSSPMTIAWGESAPAVGDATLTLQLSNLDLAHWQALLGNQAPAGQVSAQATLSSQKAGQRLDFDLQLNAEQLVVMLETNRLTGLAAQLRMRGEALNLSRYQLTEYRAGLTHLGASVASLEGSGFCDTTKSESATEHALRADLPALTRLLSRPDLKASSGTFESRIRLGHQGETIRTTGSFTLAGFTGQFAGSVFRDYGLDGNLDLEQTGQRVQIRQLAGHLTSAGQPGGRFEFSGQHDLASNAGDLALKLSDLNQHALTPFVSAALGDQQLVSGSLNSTASARLSATGDASVQAELQLANLVVADGKTRKPSPRLEAGFSLDAGMTRNVAQVRQARLKLTPTERAQNELTLTGTVDLSVTNAITGTLKLAAESLDLTQYYDAIAGKPMQAKPAPTAPPTDPTKEPEALSLPFRNFTFELIVGRLHLHEVDVADWRTMVKLDGGHVVLKPCQLTLNGAPVNANMEFDVSVPGYRYDLTLGAQAVPLRPLVNSFLPERKDQVGGHLTAGADVKGAGVTGANLEKNLAGQFHVLATNLSLSLTNVRTPVLNTVINVVVGIPDLIRDPTAALGNLLGGLTAAGRPRSGWADELTARPIDVILAHGQAGGGRVELQQAEVRSTAFLAAAQGHVTLSPILTNSAVQIPLTISLSRALTERAGLLPANTPTNLAYVAMPPFVRLKGTLGKPEADINKLALVGLAAKTSAGLAKQIGGATSDHAGALLNVVGGLLGVATPATNVTVGAETNAPASTNATPQPGLLDLFRRPERN